MPSIGDIFVNLGLRDDQFRSGMKKSGKELDRFRRNVKGSLQVFANLSLVTGVNLATIGRGLGKMVLAGAKFESSMAKIHGLVGINRKEVAKYSAEIRKLSRQGFDLNELADAFFFITSAGLRGADALDALEYSAKAAKAGLGEMKTIADAATSAMNAYGAENLSAGKAVGQMVGAIREGKLEAQKFAPVLGNLLPAASELGIEFEEVSAALAALSRTGYSAARGATALDGIMRALLRPPQEVREEFERLGLSIEGLRDIARNDGFLAYLNALSKAVDGSSTKMAKLFPEVEALKGAFALTGRNARATGDIFSKIAGDDVKSADDAFGAVADTMENRLSMSMASLEESLARLGDKFLPPLSKGFENFTDGILKTIDAVERLRDVAAAAPGSEKTAEKWADWIEGITGPISWGNVSSSGGVNAGPSNIPVQSVSAPIAQPEIPNRPSLGLPFPEKGSTKLESAKDAMRELRDFSGSIESEIRNEAQRTAEARIKSARAAREFGLMEDSEYLAKVKDIEAARIKEVENSLAALTAENKIFIAQINADGQDGLQKRLSQIEIEKQSAINAVRERARESAEIAEQEGALIEEIERTANNRRREANLEYANQSLEKARERQAALQDLRDLELTTISDEFELRLERERDYHERSLAQLNEHLANKQVSEGQYNALKDKLESAHAKRTSQIQAAAVAHEKRIMANRVQSLTGSFSQILSVVGKGSKQIFFITKALQVANAIVSAHAAAAQALAHPPGPPTTVPLAKWALGIGYANAAAIAATAFGGGGGGAGGISGAPSVSTPSAGGGAGTGAVGVGTEEREELRPVELRITIAGDRRSRFTKNEVKDMMMAINEEVRDGARIGRLVVS